MTAITYDEDQIQAAGTALLDIVGYDGICKIKAEMEQIGTGSSAPVQALVQVINSVLQDETDARTRVVLYSETPAEALATVRARRYS